MKRIPVSQRGTAVIEFALVLPLLLFIFFGMVEFSIALLDKSLITSASREAARAGIVYTGPGTTLTDAQIRAIALDNCDNLIAFQGSPAPTVTISRTTSPEFDPQKVLTVAISYPYSGLGLGALLTTFTGPITLNASTTMKFE